MLKQVIIVPQDVKMSKGKTASQVAHAAVHALDHHLAVVTMVREWRRDGMTKIVLQVPTKEDLYPLIYQANQLGLPHGLIHDNGSTEVEPGSVTALAIGPGDATAIDSITGKLALL